MNALAGYDLEDVSETVKQFGFEPREEFKPAFPELGAFKAQLEARRATRAQRPWFVACDQCKFGWLIVKRHGETEATECECLQRWRRGVQAYAPIADHATDLREHPERYVPVDYCMQVGKELSAIKAKRSQAGHPMTDAEYQHLRNRLTKEMNDRWLAELRGVKKPVVSEDRKTVAAGER